MKLVGVEWMVLEKGQTPAPRIMGRRFDGPMDHNGAAPMHYDLHVWTRDATRAAPSRSTTRA
jgi:hypothetical protein